MTLCSQQVATNDEKPTLLYPSDSDGVELVISTSAEIYVGNSDLTEKTGFKLDRGEILSLSLAPGELIYGLGVATVYVLATKND